MIIHSTLSFKQNYYGKKYNHPRLFKTENQISQEVISKEEVISKGFTPKQ
jgi:hypothetical protein